MTPTEKLRFGIQRSTRYHNHRRRFYELWNSATVTVAALGGSSVAVTSFVERIGGLWWLPGVLGVIIGLLAALDIGIGTAKSANLHTDLARRFIRLEQRLAHGRELSDEELADATRERLEIEADEPTALLLLDVICHLELLRSQDDRRTFPTIPRWRRKTIHWLSHYDYAQGYIHDYYQTKE